MERRNFMRAAALGAPLSGLLATSQAAAAASAAPGQERAYQLDLLKRMAEPVLGPMSRGELKKKFVLELSPTWDGRDPAGGREQVPGQPFDELEQAVPEPDRVGDLPTGVPLLG